MYRIRRLLLLAAALLPALATGCNPLTLGLWTPIPVQPWVAERMEEKYCYKNDHRTPILPPVRDGFPAPICEDPPTEREVLRAMPRIVRGVPYFYEEHRDDIQIVTERLALRPFESVTIAMKVTLPVSVRSGVPPVIVPDVGVRLTMLSSPLALVPLDDDGTPPSVAPLPGLAVDAS